MVMEQKSSPSKLWYLLPIFFGIIGGVIMYVALRREANSTAKKGLILGIVLGVIGGIIWMGMMATTSFPMMV